MAHTLQERREERSGATLQESTRIDVLYLFGCFVTWRKDGDKRWYQEILSAAEDPDEEVSMAAKFFLQECERLVPSQLHASSKREKRCQS